MTETSDLAADLLVLAARDRGLPLVRFDQDDVPDRMQVAWHGDGGVTFRGNGAVFDEGDVSGAWFRRPPHAAVHATETVRFVARETAGFLEGIWETVPRAWMNQPAAARRAERKLLQLREAAALGLAVPRTLATNAPDAARNFANAGPVVAKMVSGGRIGADRAIYTTAITRDDLTRDEAVAASPTLFQARVDTVADLRVTVVATRVFAARITIADRAAQDLDWRQVDPARVRYARHDVPQAVAAQCVALLRRLGLRYGAFDFVVAASGEIVFLELNPAGQWGWIERATGLPITDAILDELGTTQ